MRDAAVAAASGGAVLLASFSNFLAHNHYPVLRTEVVVLGIAFVAAAAVMGVLYRSGGPLGRLGLAALLPFLAFDLNFDGPLVLALALGTLLVARSRTVPLLGIAAAVVLATEVVAAAIGAPRPAAEQPKHQEGSGLPPLVHIVLDEHIGVEGLLGDAGRSAALREKLKSFYVGHGFRLYGGAYSAFFHTVNAMPDLLNFYGGENVDYTASEPRSIDDNAYFERLERLGYRIHVLQTDYIDFCGPSDAGVCSTLPADTIGAVADEGLALGRRIDLVGSSFLSMSTVVGSMTAAYDDLAAQFEGFGVDLPKILLFERRRTSSMAALARLDQLAELARAARPGTAYFAHVLLPHDPYALTGDCHPRQAAWLTRFSKASESAIFGAYLDQVACAMVKVGQVVENLDAAVGPNRSIVVVHGDHGARAHLPDPYAKNLKQLGDEDVIRGFSTLFAVRAPDIAPGYESSRMPVASLLDAASGSGFKSIELPDENPSGPFVVLTDDDARPTMRLALPPWWARR